MCVHMFHYVSISASTHIKITQLTKYNHLNMLHFLQVIVLLLAFISYQHEAIAQSDFYLPLNKHTDAAKPLYSAHIFKEGTNYLIDIDAPFTWFGCWPTWNMQYATRKLLPWSLYPCRPFLRRYM